VALEVGGISSLFTREGCLPIYPDLARLDRVDFKTETIWSTPDSGATPAGRHYIGEATALQEIAAGSYDLLLSSHVIEHVANPLKALKEWRRVLRPAGAMILVVPNYRETFDHRRPVTKLGHLVEDWERGVGEDDQTHLPEALALHDFGRDPGWERPADFAAMAAANATHRVLHHHIFDERLARSMLEQAGFRVRALTVAPGCHIVAVAEPAPL
jgi:SAM-dependent methyltransferase